jgi:2-polyprenyl-3-methyl-5-hydroxy-6-metoxy-1,4-benzoquinol methylase
MRTRYDDKYFAPYLERNLAGTRRGTKWFLNSYWARQLRRLACSDARILEVGSGLGFFASRIARDFSFTGLDISLAALAFIRRQWNLTSLICADAVALPCRSGAFDVVVAFDVIEHLFHPEIFLAEAERVLRDGGVLILTTPNPASFGARRKPRCATNGPVWFGYRDQTHVSIRPIEEWAERFC